MTTVVKERHRFVFLDALRGFAAFAVAELHAANFFAAPGFLFLKGSLMVDLFFCLSGFVLAHANTEALTSGRMTFGRFMLLRYIRIWPMLLLGTALGAVATFYVHPELSPSRDNIPMAAVLSVFSFPFREGGRFTWLDLVFWSLLAELVVNALFAAFAYRLRTTTLSVLTLMAVAGYSYAIKTGSFFVFYNLEDIPGTVVRATASFFAGVLVYRLWASKRFAPKTPWWVLLLVVGLVLLLPTRKFGTLLFLVMPILVALVFPLVVLAGARAEAPFLSWLDRLGRASFPLYAIHSPVLALLGDACSHWSPAPRLMAMVASLLLVLVLALIVADYYETPFRRLLRQLLSPPRTAADRGVAGQPDL